MRYTYITGILSIAMVFASCNTNEPEAPKKHQFTDPVAPDETNIETFFDQNVFTSDTMAALLKELNVCDPKQSNLTDLRTPACSPKFFRFFTYADGVPLENAFLLLTKAGVHGYAVRRLYVFQRERGELVQVNRFIANLIGKRRSASGYADLVLRFADRDQNHFNCLYVWKNNHYEFSKVEQINDSNVKAEYQAEMDQEISKMIVDEKMYI